MKWSDGVPFDGDDVVWSTNAVNNQANNEIGRDGWDLITKIDEPDKFTVVYHLSKPYSAFLPTFFGSAGANPCILPKHLLASLPNFNNADYNSKPVGIGPFRYVRWARGDRVELEPNPFYWRGKPKLQHITYRFIPDRNTLLTQMQTGEAGPVAESRVGLLRSRQGAAEPHGRALSGLLLLARHLQRAASRPSAIRPSASRSPTRRIARRFAQRSTTAPARCPRPR